MGSFAKRKPYQLSGGQQQRVALARALVLEPTVLLLDEPMGALDAKLRKQLQLELRLLQREVGTTFVYVTHDQEEALTMSDRLAVMHAGKVMQVGTPSEVYSQPATLVRRHLPRHHQPLPRDRHRRRRRRPHLPGRRHDLAVGPCEHDPAVGDDVSLMVRPERVEVAPLGRRPRHPDADAHQHPPRQGRGPRLPRRPHRRHPRLQRACGIEAEVANIRGEPPDWLTTGSAVRRGCRRRRCGCWMS